MHAVRFWCIGGVVLIAGIASHVRGQEEGARNPLVVIDSSGKEIKIKDWRFLSGTRRLGWLASDSRPPQKGPKKAAAGPEYLEFREDKSTTYQNGILSLVPIASIRRIDYDNDKKTVTLTLVGPEGKDLALRGPTKYLGINKVVVEGDADLGDLGWGAVKFQGGDPKNPKGIKGIRFPAPRPAAAGAGRAAAVTSRDKDKTLHQVVDLIALYRFAPNDLRPLPILMFKKTVKIELGRIQKMRHIEADGKKLPGHDFEVTLADGEHQLTLLDKIDQKEGKPAVLVGLAGRIPAGLKLFPPHTIAEVRFWEARKE